MKSTRKLNRRSFLGRVVGGAVLGGGALVVLSGKAGAHPVSDNDSGRNADPAGGGRSGHFSDNDSGRNADPVNHGRGTRRAVSDNDTGRNADPAGRPRGSYSDNDTGQNSDPVGRGRR